MHVGTSCHSAAAAMDPSKVIHPWSCSPVLPLLRCIDAALSLVRGAASSAQCQLGCVAVECGRCWWRHLPARQVILSSSPATQCIAVSDWALPWRPVLAVALLCPSVAPCGPRWIAGRLLHRPAAADVPWRRPLAAAPAHRLFGPPLAMPPNHAHPPTTHKLSVLLQPALCSVLSRPQRTAISKQPTQLLAEQCGIQCSVVQSSAAPNPLGTQKSVPARRPAGLQQTVSSFNPGRCPSPLPFSNSPSPP